MEMRPLRSASAVYAAVYIVSPISAAVNGESRNQSGRPKIGSSSLGSAKKRKNSWTSSGVFRNDSTYAAGRSLEHAEFGSAEQGQYAAEKHRQHERQQGKDDRHPVAAQEVRVVLA